MNEYKNKILILTAHPDDEIIFLWPFLPYATAMISCVDDLTHPKRQWCNKRKYAFAEIGQQYGIKTKVLRYDSGFSRLSQDKGAIKGFVEEVRENIKEAEVIATHNSWGEYGHLDHVLLNQICRMSGKQVLTTDILLDADWYSPKRYYQGEEIAQAKNDVNEYRRNLEIYRKYGAMGWTYPMVTDCRIINVRQN